ncbi:MAG: DMT family transporter [Candidatus Paceibacterota bacterium]
MGIIAGLFSVLGWGIADFLGAISSRKSGHLLTLFWMQFVGFLIALVYFFAKFKNLSLNDVFNFIPILVVCGILEAVAYLAFYKGFVEGQVSLVSPIGSSWPVLTLILSLIFLEESLSINRLLAIVLIFLGIIMISINLKVFQKNKLNNLKGVKEGIIAMLGWGVMFFLLTGPSRALGWFLPVFVFRLFAVLFLFFLIIINKQSFRVEFKPASFAILLLIGLLDVGAFFTYTFGIQTEMVSVIAAVVATFPLVTIILARIFLKEKIVLNQIFGIISIIAGLVLISI